MSKPIAIIAAITLDHAIGKGNDMIYHISADLKRFKEITMGHPLIMGRRTFESFPKGPLPGRRNIVITRNPNYHADGIETYGSLQEALNACEGAQPFIIGGGNVYAQAMPLASNLIITEINAECPDADTFFPAINPEEWVLAAASPYYTDPRSGAQFRYLDYHRLQ